MTHQVSFLGLVQLNRHAELLKNKVAFEIVTRRGQGSRTACDNDHVGTVNSLLLKKLSHGRTNALIETAQYGRIRYILIGWRVKVENFLHLRHAFILNGKVWLIESKSCPQPSNSAICASS